MSTSHESIAIEAWPSEDGKQQIFTLRGSLDVATASTVRAALLDATQANRHELIVDLTHVEFLDSTGLGALIGCNKRAKEAHGELRLVVDDGQILRLLRITGLLGVLAAYPSMDAAVTGGDRIEEHLEPLADSTVA